MKHLARSTYSINAYSIKLNSIAPPSISASNAPFFYLAGSWLSVPCFLYLGKCPASSCPEAPHCGFPGERGGDQDPAFPSGPRGTTQLVESSAKKAAGMRRAPIRWPGPGPVAPSSPAHSLCVGPGCLRKLTGARVGPKLWLACRSRSPPRQPPSQPRLQAAAQAIVSPSSSAEC